MIIKIIDFISKYWTLIIFFSGFIFSFVVYVLISIEGIKCSLRNDILQIYEEGKKDKKLSAYQYESILKSAELYFKLKGNSFVKDIVEKIKQWEVIE